MEGALPSLRETRKEARLCRRRYSCAWRPSVGSEWIWRARARQVKGVILSEPGVRLGERGRRDLPWGSTGRKSFLPDLD